MTGEELYELLDDNYLWNKASSRCRIAFINFLENDQYTAKELYDKFYWFYRGWQAQEAGKWL